MAEKYKKLIRTQSPNFSYSFNFFAVILFSINIRMAWNMNLALMLIFSSMNQFLLIGRIFDSRNKFFMFLILV